MKWVEFEAVDIENARLIASFPVQSMQIFVRKKKTLISGYLKYLSLEMIINLYSCHSSLVFCFFQF